MNKEVLEGNRLIATFMNHGGGANDEYKNKPFEYHLHWNFLMPVVEKIESMEDKDGNWYKFDIINRVEVECSAGEIPICYIHSFEAKSKIDGVYKAVIQFINHFNQTQKR